MFQNWDNGLTFARVRREVRRSAGEGGSTEIGERFRDKNLHQPDPQTSDTELLDAELGDVAAAAAAAVQGA